jgi:hypothetical protein
MKPNPTERGASKFGQIALNMIRERPSLLNEPGLLWRFMACFWLKSILHLAPRRTKNYPLRDWRIPEKSKCAIESLAPVLAKVVCSALGWKSFEKRFLSLSREKFIDELIFLYCRLEPTLEDPFIRLRTEEAARQNNTEFFKRLGESLKEGPIDPLDDLKLLLIYGWHVPLAPGIPRLWHCTDNSISEFATGFLDRPNLSEAAVKKARQRLKLTRARGGQLYHHAKFRFDKWKFS